MYDQKNTLNTVDQKKRTLAMSEVINVFINNQL